MWPPPHTCPPCHPRCTQCRLLCITLAQAFRAGHPAELAEVHSLLEDPTRWAVDERLMLVATGVVGLAMGTTSSSSAAPSGRESLRQASGSGGVELPGAAAAAAWERERAQAERRATSPAPVDIGGVDVGV